MNLVLFVAIMSLVAESASAASSSHHSISLRGRVPVVCNISTGSTQKLTENEFTISSVSEFCNTASGYRVYAVHSSEDFANLKSFSYSGRDISPSNSGRTLVYEARGPARRTNALNVTLHDGGQTNIAITFLIVAK